MISFQILSMINETEYGCDNGSISCTAGANYAIDPICAERPSATTQEVPIKPLYESSMFN